MEAFERSKGLSFRMILDEGKWSHELSLCVNETRYHCAKRAYRRIQ